jgi:predicted DNA-binding transcriptional regulator YafY
VPSKKAARWGQRRRLEFIDFRLYWEGRINRADLTGHFGISVPQASLDLARYQQLAPTNLMYDRREKVYLATRDFHPVLTSASSDDYLAQLLAVASGTLLKNSVFIGWAPPADVLRAPHRRIPADALLAVLRAIQQLLVLEVEYQSSSQAAPTRRVISPHAIAFDGFRWHTRAYCHARKEFRDFVVGRLLEIRPQSKSDIDPQLDHDWNTFVEIKIVPQPDLTAGQRRAVELDYGMNGGVAVLPTRRAMLQHVLKHLGLSGDSTSRARNKIVLSNRDKLARFLPDGKADVAA